MDLIIHATTEYKIPQFAPRIFGITNGGVAGQSEPYRVIFRNFLPCYAGKYLMKRSVRQLIGELLQAGVIDEAVAGRIQAFYSGRQKEQPERLLLIFGIIGALLVGLGVILVIGHNWDRLQQGWKLFFAFLPLLTGQLLTLNALLRRAASPVWREGSSVFLFFAVGACLALISQIYQIPGDVDQFLLTWMLLCILQVYLLQSGFTGLLLLAGITAYGIGAGYGNAGNQLPWPYWAVMAGMIPFYMRLRTAWPESNYVVFYEYAICLSLSIMLGSAADRAGALMVVAYLALFGLFMLLGSSGFYRHNRLLRNPWLLSGWLGSAVIWLLMSFRFYWEELAEYDASVLFFSREMLLVALLASPLLYGLFRLKWNAAEGLASVLLAGTFLMLLLVPLSRWEPLLPQILTNGFVLALALALIVRGTRARDLTRVNLGMTLVAALVACRFFDTQWSFILKGVIFMVLGSGFFVLNYLIGRRKRAEE